jgi:hypothetical protein
MKRHSTNPISGDELKEYVDVINYELSMLLGTASICYAGIPSDSPVGFPIHNSALESFCIHSRNLISFLYPDSDCIKVFPTDVTILNYVSKINIDLYRPNLSDQLRNTYIMSNKTIMHFTYDRLSLHFDDAGRIWNFLDISKEIMNIFANLQPYFYQERVPEKFFQINDFNWFVYKFDVKINDIGGILIQPVARN